MARIAIPHRAPADLAKLQAWLLWRWEEQPGGGKARKVPYYSSGGRRHGVQGSPEDRAKLTTFPAARDAALRIDMDGVGVAMLPEWDLTGLDFDNCLGADGQIPDEIMEIVGQTYCEISPSGNGVRAFVKGTLGDRKSRARGNEYGFEIFSEKGFLTLTGNVLPVCEALGNEDRIAHAGDAVRALCQQRFGSSEPKSADPDDPFAGHEPRLGLTPEQIEAALNKLDPGMSRESWIVVGMSLHHESEGDDTGFWLWNSWSSGADNYAGEEDLRKQWDSFERRQGAHGRSVTMRSVLKMVKDLTPITSAEEVERAAQEGASLAKLAKGYNGRFPFRSAAELANAPPLEWLIKGIIPRADIVMLYGPSGSGKTFVALQLGGAIARGVEWRGRRVTKGRVVIIAAEGGGGYNVRIQAYARQAGVDIADLDIGVCTVPPNICRRDDITELTKAIVAAGGAALIIIDTLAQVTPGANENSGEDMGLALAHVRALREATGAVIMIVHHSGKDTARGARGWSGLKGSVDAALEVTRHTNGHREIHVDKMRDGEDGLRYDFRLQVVDMGTDQDGDPLSSCVVIDVDRQQESTLRKGPSGKAQKAILQIVLQLGGNTIVGAALADVTAAIIEQKGPPQGRDNRTTNARRDIKKLVAEGFLFERVERLYIADGAFPNGAEVDA